MGEIIIEFPFNVKRRFRILDSKIAVQILNQLEELETRSVASRRLQVTDVEVLSV